MKRCPHCGETKAATPEFWHRNRSNRDGLAGWCKPCSSTVERDADKARERNRTHDRKRQERRRGYMSNFRLKTKYGITQEERDGMLAEQSGACASCGDTEVKFVVDHNHNTGAIRGILCSPCNLALGHLHDDPERIEALLTYLTKQPVDA